MTTKILGKMTMIEEILTLDTEQTQEKEGDRVVVYKECTKCMQIKEFYRSNRSWCKDCDSRDARYRMGRTKNRIRTAYRDARKAAKKYGAYDDLTSDDVFYAFAIAGNRCAYCGKLSNKLELEHVVPISRGGSNTISNITTACKMCNREKYTGALLTYLFMNIQDETLIVAAIERIAYRAGIDRMEVFERLKEQYFDYSREDAIKSCEQFKKQEERSRRR